MSEANIREAMPDDVADIQYIAKRGWNTAYDSILSQNAIDAAMREWYDAETVREFIDHEEVEYFVAEHDGIIVGYVSGGPNEVAGVASLGAIYVDPDHWDEGIGTTLLERFEAFCRRQGYKTVQFQVLSDNDVGMAFYQKHGYEIVDECKAELFGETVNESRLSGRIE